MWKLILAECRYHWIAIGLAYASILLLAASTLLFGGMTWQGISTASSLILIILASRQGAVSTKEKRLRNIIPLAVENRTLLAARILVPAILVGLGLTILWLSILFFSPQDVTVPMTGRSLLLFAFVFLNISVFTFIIDLKQVLTGFYGRVLFSVIQVFLALLLVAVMGGVYLIYNFNVRTLFGVENLYSYLVGSPGVFIFAFGILMLGMSISAANIRIFERRRSFLE